MKRRDFICVLMLMCITIFNIGNSWSQSGARGSYTGEYQWFIRNDQHNWVSKVFGSSMSNHNGPWGGKFYLSYKIEVVSFPFLPDFEKTNLEKRVLNVESDATFDAKKDAWRPYWTVPIMYKKKEELVATEGGARPYVDPSTGYSLTAIYVNKYSTLISNLFESDDFVHAKNVLNSNYGEQHRDYFPHTILKHTLYLCSSSDSVKIDSMSFIKDLTRTHNRYPWYKENVNNSSDITHDIDFFSSLSIPKKYSECYGSQTCNKFGDYNTVFKGLQDPVNTGKLVRNFTSLQYFPFDQSNHKTIDGVEYSPSSYDPPLAGSNPKDNQEYLHPAPYSIYVHHNNQNYQSGDLRLKDHWKNYDDHDIGVPHTYRVDKNIDLSKINSSEKIIYNPSSLLIGASNLHFPSGYQFRSFIGYTKFQMDYPTYQEVLDSDPGRYYSDLRDVPVESRLNTNGEYNASIYHVEDGATLTIEPCVGLFDLTIYVKDGGKVIYDETKVYGRFRVEEDPDAILHTAEIVRNHTFNGCHSCKDDYDKDKVVIDGPNGVLPLLGTNKINEEITIKSGGRLKITNQTLYMGSEGRIVVEPGGQLELDNAVLTSDCQWEGVIVQGDPDYPYTGTFQDPLIHGTVFMINGSIIENARNGIYSEDLGIIEIDNSSFLNNRYAINANDGKVYVKTSAFKTNGNFHYADPSNEQDMIAFIKATDANLNLRGNSFVNENSHYTNAENYGIGILSYGSEVNVWEYTTAHPIVVNGYRRYGQQANVIRSNFKGLHKGIDHYGWFNMSGNLFVVYTDFANIGKGVTSASSVYDEIALNTISLDPTKVNGIVKHDLYGVFMVNCGSHFVAQNQIKGAVGQGYGIVNKQTGPQSFSGSLGMTGNTYRNSLQDLTVGIQHEGINEYTGMECNNFVNNNENAFVLTSARGALGTFVPGIQGDLGECTAMRTAGNVFDDCGVTGNNHLVVATKNINSDFVYTYANQNASDAPQCVSSPVTLNMCGLAPNQCYSILSPSLSLDGNVILAKINKRAIVDREVLDLKDQLMRYYFRTDQLEKAAEFLNNEKAIEARKWGVMHALSNGDNDVVLEQMEQIPGNNIENIKFRELSNIMMNSYRKNSIVNEKLSNEKESLETLRKTNTVSGTVAEGLLARVDNRVIEREPFYDHETVFETEIKTIQSENTFVEAYPNPSGGDVQVKYNLGDNSNGTIYFRDAVTGRTLLKEPLYGESTSVQLDVSGFARGNYIIELHGDGEYLKAIHFMKF